MHARFFTYSPQSIVTGDSQLIVDRLYSHSTADLSDTGRGGWV